MTPARKNPFPDSLRIDDIEPITSPVLSERGKYTVISRHKQVEAGLKSTREFRRHLQGEELLGFNRRLVYPKSGVAEAARQMTKENRPRR